MNSAFYDGWVRRRHYSSRELLRVPVTAVYLDLAETTEIFESRWFWSFERAAPAWLRREDFFGDPTLTLDETVRRLVFEDIGKPIEGPIRMLSQLRTWGFARGPANAFYCFDATDSRLEAVVLDVRSIPGVETQRRVFDASEADYDGERYRWNESESDRVWMVGKPGSSLIWHLEQSDAKGRLLDATLALDRRPLDTHATVKTLFLQPISTARLCLTL